MNRPAIRQRRDAAPAPRLSTELLAELAARLTPRDIEILELVREHRVLTTPQLATIFFTSQLKARHRLLELHRLTALVRFRPWTPSGSRPWHWVLGPAGAAVLAARAGLSAAEFGYRRKNATSISHSVLLAHQVGVNEFFTQLHHIAHTHPKPHSTDMEDGAKTRTGTGVVAWWSERRCTKLWGDLARPDAYGRWAEPASCPASHPQVREVDFFLEHDTGSETLTKVAAKLADYTDLAEATGVTTPVLFWLPSARRETNLRKLLTETEVPAATAVHTNPGDPGTPEGPAGAVWLPCGTTEAGRLRLAELDTAWPAATRQARRHTAPPSRTRRDSRGAGRDVRGHSAGHLGDADRGEYDEGAR